MLDFALINHALALQATRLTDTLFKDHGDDLPPSLTTLMPD